MNIFSFLSASPRVKLLRDMGFVFDQQGIFNRYAREKAGWDTHLHNCKRCIADAVAEHKAQSVAILGSGWLLDVPINELSEMCGKVYLIDLVHPGIIKHKVAKLKNVKLLEADVTGGVVEEIYKSVNDGTFRSELFSERPSVLFSAGPDVDMVVSLNILNQLDILICDFLMARTRIADEQLLGLRRFIQQSHIDSITQSAFCLITDFREKSVDMASHASSTKELVKVPFPTANNSREWVWDFDQSGNYLDNCKVSFDVRAVF